MHSGVARAESASGDDRERALAGLQRTLDAMAGGLSGLEHSASGWARSSADKQIVRERLDGAFEALEDARDDLEDARDDCDD